ncbi:MAG: diguanylate cyclase, partial [Mesorhizobium sp.]
MQTTFGTGQPGRENADLAFTDPLTGLGNHRRFYDKVDRLISDRADDPAPFAFLYPMVFSEEQAAEKSRMLIEILSAPYDVGERTARLSASVGCSLFYSGDETTEILINKAETALYHAKRSGRGRVVVYTREMEEAAKRVTRIEQALRRAVSAGEVEPHFQPIVDLTSRRTIG